MESTSNLKLNGYRASHRNKWRFIQCGLLNIQELSLLEFYADQMGFDRKNSWYGLVQIDFKKTARVFRRCPNAVRNWHKKLLKRGLIKKTAERGIFRLICHERYVNPGKRWQGKAAHYVGLEKNKPVKVMFQNFGINFQIIEDNVQLVVKKKPQNPKESLSVAISSSKVQSNLSSKKSVVYQQSRADEEYQRIYDKGGYKLLTPDDMRWIDENVGVKSIKRSMLEKNVVETFFNNDYETYKRLTI